LNGAQAEAMEDGGIFSCARDKWIAGCNAKDQAAQALVANSPRTRCTTAYRRVNITCILASGNGNGSVTLGKHCMSSIPTECTKIYRLISGI